MRPCDLHMTPLEYDTYVYNVRAVISISDGRRKKATMLAIETVLEQG